MKKLLIATSFIIAIAASAQDWAKAKLEKSPRHQEWVEVKNGNRTVHSFVVFPEVKDKAAVVIGICFQARRATRRPVTSRTWIQRLPRFTSFHPIKLLRT
jgi:hypothetical protein